MEGQGSDEHPFVDMDNRDSLSLMTHHNGNLSEPCSLLCDGENQMHGN